MSDKTGIQWTEATWNPTTGCTKVSQGCKNCYAKHQAWPRLAASQGTVYFGREFENVQTHDQRLDQPIRWRKPRRIFVNSMSDLFHEDIPDEFIERVFAVMARCPHHEFQVLTKRADRMLNWFLHGPGWSPSGDELFKAASGRWPLPNVWLGVSCEDQATADERIPLLLQTPAAVRWISAEPLLGPLSIGLYLTRSNHRTEAPGHAGLDWVVVGGESGPNARPMHPAWARTLRDQCVASRVPFFFKQIGEWTWHDFPVLDRDTPMQVLFNDGMTGPADVSYDIRTQAERSPRVVRKIGKHAAGRSIDTDGKEWNEYPNHY